MEINSRVWLVSRSQRKLCTESCTFVFWDDIHDTWKSPLEKRDLLQTETMERFYNTGVSKKLIGEITDCSTSKNAQSQLLLRLYKAFPL